MWYTLASHLKMPIQELQSKTTATEFVMWCEFLKMESEQITKNDLYLAAIVTETRRSWVDKPAKIKLDDFLIMKRPKPKPVNTAKSGVLSKQFWLGALGIKNDTN